MYRMSNGGIFLSPSLPAASQPSTPQRNPGGMNSSYNRQSGHSHEHGHPRPLHHMDSGIDIGGSGVNEKQTYRLLSPAEWARFCHGVGVFRDNESQEVMRPKSTLWPARGFRDGLYQDVLVEQAKFSFWYHTLSVFRWSLLLLQIGLGAILTALGAFRQDGTVITVIAAINTSIAGVLAMLHNSGVPERFRNDRNEFKRLEEYIRSVVDTGLIRADEDVHEALAACFERFRAAHQSVENNVPGSYAPAPAYGGAAAGGPIGPNPIASAAAATAATATTAAARALSRLFDQGQNQNPGPDQSSHPQQQQQQQQQHQQQSQQHQQPYSQMQHPQMQQRG